MQEFLLSALLSRRDILCHDDMVCPCAIDENISASSGKQSLVPVGGDEHTSDIFRILGVAWHIMASWFLHVSVGVSCVRSIYVLMTVRCSDLTLEAKQCRKHNENQRNGFVGSVGSVGIEAFPLVLMAHQSCGPLGTPAPPLAKALWDAVVVVLPLSQPQCEDRSCRMISSYRSYWIAKLLSKLPNCYPNVLDFDRTFHFSAHLEQPLLLLLLATSILELRRPGPIKAPWGPGPPCAGCHSCRCSTGGLSWQVKSSECHDAIRSTWSTRLWHFSFAKRRENMENQDTDESGSDVDEIIDILNHSHSIQITQDMDLKTD